MGRSTELEALFEARRALAQSRGSVVLVAAEAGMGKSRLLAQFLASVARDTRPRNLASTECLERAEEPFGPFRRLFAALGFAFPTEAGDDSTAALFASVASTLHDAAAKRATILTLDDLHWADRSSLELLAYLAPRVANRRLMIVGTYRTDEVEASAPLLRAVSAMLRSATVSRVSLDRLSDSQTLRLIEGALSDGRPLAVELRDDVIARSEGNPFFAEELLKNALEPGSGSPAGRQKLPISIRAAIADRLAALTPEERRVVAGAAVLGYRFDPELLALTMDVEIDAVVAALARGRDLNIFTEEDDARARFRFRHALTRQVVYDAMLRFDARRTHARILATLESLGDEDRHIDALAYHAWQAQDQEKTARYNERAGESALALRALPEARACFERAREAATSSADAARLSERAGFVAEMQGALGDAVDRYASALALYKELEDFDRACDVVRAISTNRNNLGDLACIAFGTSFLDTYGDRVSPPKRDTLLALLARLAAIQYDDALVARLVEQIENPDALPPRAKQNYLITRMDTSFNQGDIPAWSTMAFELLALFDSLPPFVQLTAMYAVAQSGTILGQNAIAERAFARANDVESRWDFSAVRSHGFALRAQRSWLLGRIDEACAYIRRGLEPSEATVARLALSLVAMPVAALTGDASLVPPEMESEVEASRTGDLTADDAQILAGAAAWSFACGRDIHALADIRRGMKLVTRPTAWSGYLLWLAAERLPDRELEPIRAMLRSATIHPSDVVGRSHTSLALAIIESRTGDAAVARELAEAAARGYRGLGWVLFESRARAILGEAGDGALPGAQPAPARTPLDALSKREGAIARMVADGATNAAIGEALGVGTKTVEKHVSSMFRKLNVSNRAQVAALLARRH